MRQACKHERGTIKICLRSQLFRFQQPQVEPLSHLQRRQTLDRDVNWSGWMCHCAATTCRGHRWSQRN